MGRVREHNEAPLKAVWRGKDENVSLSWQKRLQTLFLQSDCEGNRLTAKCRRALAVGRPLACVCWDCVRKASTPCSSVRGDACSVAVVIKRACCT